MAGHTIRRKLRAIGGELVHRGWRAVRVFGAIHPGSARSERFGYLGEGCVISFPAASLYGEGSIHIGANTMIAPWATIAAGYSDSQTDVPERALVIGERCVIGIRSGIAAHESIEIGDDVWIGQDVFITDSNHGFDDPDVPIGLQLGDHEPVRVGSGSWIGHGAVVLPGCQLGKHVVVAAGSVVTDDVPEYSVVAGVPAKVVRRIPSSSSARHEATVNSVA